MSPLFEYRGGFSMNSNLLSKPKSTRRGKKCCWHRLGAPLHGDTRGRKRRFRMNDFMVQLSFIFESKSSLASEVNSLTCRMIADNIPPEQATGELDMRKLEATK